MRIALTFFFLIKANSYLFFFFFAKKLILVVILLAPAGQDMQILFQMLDTCVMNVFILLFFSCPSLPLEYVVV